MNNITKINMELPLTCIIEDEVMLGENITILPNTFIRGKSVIGDNAIIGPNSEIINSKIDENTIIYHSIIIDSKIGKNTKVGPFAHIRNNAIIEDNVKVGNYVEIKKSHIKNNNKISHLSYIGDTEMEENCNIGAGVITANYDGKNKNKTMIKKNCFIGSNSTLIAPLTIDEDSLIAAGSTITKDVPSSSLAIARSYQINKKRKENW